MTPGAAARSTPIGSYLTPERLEFQHLAREFTHREVLPLANLLDPVDGQIPHELRNKMARLGLFAILISEENGGLGLGVFEYCLVAEELARGWMSVASLMARGNGLLGGFTPAQERALLPQMAKGNYLGAFALSEAEAGSDVANLSCRAEKLGDQWVVTGTKMWCTFADQADFIIVFARTGGDVEPAHRRSGISAFLVNKERGTFPKGLSGTPMRKIGYRGWKTWELSFDGVRLPAGALIGEEGRGFHAAMAKLEVARAHTAARSVGLAQAALEDAVAYAKQRQQFGRPISDFQSIRFKIADMAAQIEASRQLYFHACTKIDAGEDANLEASMAKYVASEMAERVCSEGLQIHGGAGYTTEFAAERYWRDARLTRIFEGTSEIQLQLISDRLLGRTA